MKRCNEEVVKEGYKKRRKKPVKNKKRSTNVPIF
jgi:hypothetical protein